VSIDDYSSLFATFHDCSPPFALFETIRTIRDYSLFAIRVFQTTLFCRVIQDGKFILFQPILGTTDFPSYTSENLFSEHRSQIIMAICGLHGWFVFLPQFMAICRRQAAKHSFLIIIRYNNNIIINSALQKSYTLRIYTANTWLRACAHDVICPCCGGEGRGGKSVPKILDTNWIRIALHHLHARFKLITETIVLRLSKGHQVMAFLTIVGGYCCSDTKDITAGVCRNGSFA